MNPNTSGGRHRKYCKRPECVRARKAKAMRELYYKQTGRPELARYVRVWQR